MAAAKKAVRAKSRKPAKPRRKKVAVGTRGLGAAELSSLPSPEGAELAKAIEADGGQALAVYREPLGGNTVVFASLPIDKVEPTPYQRDVSMPHVKRLADAMERVGRFLDPLIAVRHEGKYWTPNGNHRLNASKLLGAKAVVALVLPEPDAAYQILALNTEKAHNLKERSLEVIRMHHALAEQRSDNESAFAALFEEPAFITIGAAYEKRPRLAGGAYQPIVKRLDTFLDVPITEAKAIREARCDVLLAFDDEVGRIVANLKEKGFDSPYLKNYVVARLNFLRFKPDSDLEFDATFSQLLDKARKFDLGKVKKEDIARTGGPIETDEG